MFDAHYFPTEITPKEINAFDKVRNTIISGYCCFCHKKIELTWNKDLVLSGHFAPLVSSYSEIWTENLPDLDSMLCISCWEEYERQKAAAKKSKRT